MVAFPSTMDAFLSRVRNDTESDRASSEQPPSVSAATMSEEDEIVEEALTDMDLTLLCLDHLRHMRKRAPLSTIGVKPDYLTIACWALNQSIFPDNDSFVGYSDSDGEQKFSPSKLPSLSQMEESLQLSAAPEYDDLHPSNAHRLYSLAGLGMTPLGLGPLVAAGAVGLAARTRKVAEAEMVQSPLFDVFVQAVTAKGFFHGDYASRHQKVVAKFRTKLAAKAQDETQSGDPLAQRAARNYEILQDHRWQVSEEDEDEPEEEEYLDYQQPHPSDHQEAERLKGIGNNHMQNKEYQEAVDAYTDALKLSPRGPQAHVYYSNRAAALVSLRDFDGAILDSERSVSLAPTYAKAHARLGLAHFLMGNYRPALEAYTVALKYEPDNKSSRNYLEKAAQRLAQQDHPKSPTSFSVVSQWDQQSKKHKAPRPTTPSSSIRDAEKCKTRGNALMASREYREALDAYSQAIELSPDGPQSHVYFSNRAAALCYLKEYQQAQRDSLQSLVLNPTYGKAHARLGLSRFFLQDYQGAVEAYEASLRYDPGNAASKSYLAKAQARLRQGA